MKPFLALSRKQHKRGFTECLRLAVSNRPGLVKTRQQKVNTMNQDQRLFFRIDVMLPCSYRVLSAQQAEKLVLPDTPDSQYIEEYFMHNLAELDAQIQEVIGQINQKSGLLASALMAMNSKINFMMQTIDTSQLSRAIPQMLVNLSANGISFTVDEAPELTDKVDLLIQPIESEPPVLVRCDIVKITPTHTQGEEPRYQMALAFNNISEDDRRKLVFFIQAKEIEYARQQREAVESK
jgi:hypothetical protein